MGVGSKGSREQHNQQKDSEKRIMPKQGKNKRDNQRKRGLGSGAITFIFQAYRQKGRPYFAMGGKDGVGERGRGWLDVGGDSGLEAAQSFCVHDLSWQTVPLSNCAWEVRLLPVCPTVDGLLVLL